MNLCRSVLTCTFLLVAAAPIWAGDAVEKEYQDLAERASKGGKSPAIRAEVLAFRQRNYGTPQAVKAAGLLRDLASPLDALDSKNIPELERFAWHPKETVAVLGEHKGRQAGQVMSVAFSKNGKWLVSTSNNGTVRIWDPATMRLLHTLGHGAGAYSAIFSKDNSLLLHGGGDGQVHVVDMTVDPPKLKETCKVASTPLLGIALGPEAKWFVTGGSDSRLCIWDLTAKPAAELTAGNAHTGAIHCVVASADGKTIVSGGADKTFRVWSFTGNKLVERTLQEAHGAAVLSLAWNPGDDKTLASGGADGTIRTWTVTGGKPAFRATFKGPTAVNGLAFSSSGKTLAAAYADGIVRVYGVSPAGGLTEKAQLDGHIQVASSVAFSADSTQIATGSHDWTVRLWPAVSGPRPKDKTIKSGHLSHVYTVAFAPDEKGLASGSYDRTIRQWDLPATLVKERTPVKANQAVYSLAYAPDGKMIAAAGDSTKVQTFDTAAGRLLNSFLGHQGAVGRVVFSPDGATLASSSPDKSLRLWYAKTGKPYDAITTFENHVNSVAYSPDGKNLLCCSGYYLFDKKGQIVYKDGQPVFLDSSVRVYDASNLKEKYRWKSEFVLPACLTYGADGKHFFAGASDNLLRRWEAAEPATEPGVFVKGATVGISHMTCSPDGRWLLAYGPDYRINLFDLETGKVSRFWSTGESFASFAFAPDSRHVAIAVNTGVVLILRLESAKGT